jgi:hypothetical protein
MNVLLICFYKCGNHPPGGAILQQQTNPAARCRTLTMAGGAGRVCGPADTKLQHFAAIRGGETAIAMTASGIHGNVDSWIDSKADFLQ